METRIQILLAAFSCLVIGCDMRSARRAQFDRDAALKTVSVAPLPPSLTDIQGMGDTWQGFSYFFRFHASFDEIEKHLAGNGFSEIDLVAMDELDRSVFLKGKELTPGMETYFDPPWSPAFGDDKRYYQKRHADGSYTGVLIGPSGDWIYLWAGAA